MLDMLCMDIRVFFEQQTETYVLNKQFKTSGFRRLEKIIEFCRFSTFSSGLFGNRWSERLWPAFNEPIFKNFNLRRKCAIFPGDHLCDVFVQVWFMLTAGGGLGC